MLKWDYKSFKNKHMSIFHHVHFEAPDPYDNGLREEIIAEQHEIDAFETLDDVPGAELVEQWTAIEEDVRKDSNALDFTND